MTTQLCCHFCRQVVTDAEGWIAIEAGEVGEFYRPAHPEEDSVLAHVGCLPGPLFDEWAIA